MSNILKACKLLPVYTGSLKRKKSAKNWIWLDTNPSWSTPFILVAILLLATFAMNLLGFGRNSTEMIIMVGAVIGLYSYSGITGIPSFGHVGFMAVGAYVAMVLTVSPVVKTYRLTLPSYLATLDLNPFLALPIAFLAGALAAAVFGIIVWRLSGLAAGIATLALLLVIYNVAGNWTNVTGGHSSVPGLPLISDQAPSFIASTLAIFATVWLSRTKHGRLARAAREDEAAAHAIGARVYLGRWIAMCYSGGIMALFGALYVYFIGSISPDLFYVSLMFLLLTYLVVGGMMSITGAVIGTIVVEVVRQLLAPLDSGWSIAGITFDGRPGLRFIVLGCLVLIMLFRRPGGIFDGYDLRFPHRRQ